MKTIKKIIYLVIFQLCAVFKARSAIPPYPTNQGCKPYEAIFPIDSPHFKYNPFFMKLNQCQGGDTNPNVGTGRVCKATKIENMNISVYYQTGLLTITVPKHTKCTFGCKSDASVCNKYQNWDETACSCECPDITPTCGKDQEWRKHQCDCVCTQDKRARCLDLGKDIDGDTCDCVPVGKSIQACTGSLALEYVIIIMLVELAVIVAIVFILYRKFIYGRNTDERVRLKDVNESDENGKAEVGGC